MALTIIVTDAGRAALVNAANNGTNPVVIAQAGISGTAVVPSKTATALPGEIKRLATISGDVVADDMIHLIVRDEGADTFTLRSFGLYLADGTLFAIYGQADPILEKSAQAMMLLAIDIAFADIDAAEISFGDADFLNPPATESTVGVVELATEAETIGGALADRAVHPKGLKTAVTNWLDSRFGEGAPSTFMKTLLTTASATALRIAIGLKSAALKDEGAGNGLDADLLDGQHGSYYANIPARLGFTPWGPSNDGTGSGLDADLLDGQQGDYYRNAGNMNAGTLPGARLSGTYGISVSGSAASLATARTIALSGGVTGNVSFNGSSNVTLPTTLTPSAVLAALLTLDGAGSGLDADLLDGFNGADFMRFAQFLGVDNQQLNPNGGYVRLPGNLILQFGQGLHTTGTGIKVVEFPRVFPNAVLLTLACNVASAPPSAFHATGLADQAGMRVFSAQSAGVAAGTGTAFSWLALGY